MCKLTLELGKELVLTEEKVKHMQGSEKCQIGRVLPQVFLGKHTKPIILCPQSLSH